MTALQEIMLELEAMSTEDKASVLRFCELLRNSDFRAEYEKRKSEHGGKYPPEMLDSFMDAWTSGGGSDDDSDHLPTGEGTGGGTNPTVCQEVAAGSQDQTVGR